MKLLANQQMQSRLIYMNDVPQLGEMNPLQFLNSSYSSNMQYLSTLQSEAYTLTQCLQQIKGQLEQLCKPDAGSTLQAPSSSTFAPFSAACHSHAPMQPLPTQLTRPSETYEAISNFKSFDQACSSSCKNSDRRQNEGDAACHLNNNDGRLEIGKGGKVIRKRQRIKPKMRCEHVDRKHYSDGLC